jgi:GT2 family glycosyltransferase
MQNEQVRVILNDDNAGFAKANNQGLAIARGDYLVFLNDDTVAPRGWLARMLRHLDDPEIGLVNAVTNYSGNESRIEVPYHNVTEMEAFATAYMRQHDGEHFDIRVAALYCVGIRRDVFEQVGPLDEAYGLGMFEDDDYSQRVRAAGYRVICAEDVFIHHYGSMTYGRMAPADYDALWARNQAHYERKWGKWEPHKSRN